jgi:hypothetical protein
MVRCHDIVSDDVGQSIRELSGVTVTYVQDLEPNRSIGDTDRPVFPDLVKASSTSSTSCESQMRRWSR